MARATSPNQWTPWTALLRYIVEKDHRTDNLVRVIVAIVGGALALSVTLALLDHAWVSLPASGAAAAVVGAVGRFAGTRRHPSINRLRSKQRRQGR